MKLSSLTIGGKIVISLVVLAIVGFIFYFAADAIKDSGAAKDLAKGVVADKFEVNEDANVVIAYNTFPGVMGVVLMNGGMEPNKESKLYKDYGILLQIKQMDGLSDTRDGLKAGIIDAAYCTIDAYSIENGNESMLKKIGAKVRMKVNESRGADALVVNSTIKNVGDLKGKKIAYAVGTASNTLLINILETSGLTVKDVELQKVENGVDAASAFKSGSVDAALVWAPDDEDCIKAVTGSKILSSTKIATSIIADGLVITDQKMEEKKELLTKLVQAWFVGNAMINDQPSARKTGIELFSKGFGLPEDVVKPSIDKIRLSTLGDNQNFFGLNPVYTGMTGDRMYTRMGQKYMEAGLVSGAAPWSKVSDSGIIEALSTSVIAKESSQAPESEVKFTAPTVAETKAEATGTKKVIINFASGSYELDDAAKNKINRDVAGLAQGLAKARIRVEGNTDNVGNPKSNTELSFKRADAVVRYLISEHKFDANKFISVGNGQSKPLCGEATEDCRAMNRRTEFQFIW